MHELIDERFRITYQPEKLDDAARNRKLVELCYVRLQEAGGEEATGVDDTDDESDVHARGWFAKRQENGKYFLEMWTGCLVGDKVYWHHCGRKCKCLNEADAKKRMHESADKVLLSEKLGVISLAKWTKWRKPTKAVSLACNTHCILQDSWQRMLYMLETC